MSSKVTPLKMRKFRLPAAIMLIILVFGTLFYMLFSPPEKQQEIVFNSPSDKNIAADNLALKVKNFSETTSHPHSVAPVLKMDEREVNAYIQSSPSIQAAMESKGVLNPRIHFNKEEVTATADVLFHGVVIPITITGNVVARSGGSMSLSVKTIKAGKLAVPRKVTEDLAKKIDEIARGGQVPLPKGVSSVKAENGALIVTGTP